MWHNIILGCLLMALTTAIHGVITRLIVHFVTKRSNKASKKKHMFEGVIWLPSIVLIMFFFTLLESALWSATYMAIGAFDKFEEALYFSIVTFTTLGFGDVVLSEEWRLLASLEAANGIIIFGWSTAIVMAVVQKLYFTKS